MGWDFHRDLYTHEIWIPGRWMNPMFWPWHIGFLFPFLVWWWSQRVWASPSGEEFVGSSSSPWYTTIPMIHPNEIPISPHFCGWNVLKSQKKTETSRPMPGGQSGFHWETHVGRLGKPVKPGFFVKWVVSVNGNCSMVKSNVSLNMCLMVNSRL